MIYFPTIYIATEKKPCSIVIISDTLIFISVLIKDVYLISIVFQNSGIKYDRRWLDVIRLPLMLIASSVEIIFSITIRIRATSNYSSHWANQLYYTIYIFWLFTLYVITEDSMLKSYNSSAIQWLKEAFYIHVDIQR